jgi:photosystem II stability/assembly factor-like uncharacterized protein
LRSQSTLRLIIGLSVSLACVTSTVAQTQREYTDPATRMAWYHKHVAMTKTTEFGGIRWQFLGPKNTSGRVTDVAIATPRGKTYVTYVAAASGGVWKTDNDGLSWKPVFQEGPSTSIGDVTLAPSNQDIVWIGTGEANIFRSSMAGCGVFKSVDAGKTWKHMGLAGTHTIPRIVIHPKNPNIVYVAASGHEWTDNPERGVYKSTDGGKNWDKILYINEQTGAIDLVMHPDDPNTLYAATWQRIRKRWNDPRNENGAGGSGIFKTTDGGANWKPMNKGLPKADWRGRIGIDICRSKPDVMYAFVDNYEKMKEQERASGNDAYGRPSSGTIKGAEIYRSDDGGKQWRKTSKSDRTMARHSGTYGWVFGQVRADPVNPDVVYTMGLGLNVSRDSGKTLQSIGRGVHGDHHALWIDPDNPNYLVNGNDGGVYTSYDGGKSWRRFTTELPLVQFFNVNYDMAEPFRVYGSIQDHGSRRGVVDFAQSRRRIKAQDWERAPGGEGSHHFIDPRNADIVYSCGFYGGISRTDLSKGRTGRSKINLEAPEGAGKLRGQWLAHFILSPHNPDVLYHGMNYLFRSKNQGKDIEIISPDLTYNDEETIGDIPFHTITAISESPLEKGVLFVGTDDGRAHLTLNDGGKWREIMDGLAPHRWVSRIEASRFTKGTVYMAQNGKRHDDFTPYLWKSSDYGKTWQSIVGNIPIGPINVVREDPKNPKVLYVGTDISVYVSIDGGKKWHVLGRKLPSTFVSDLIIHPRDDIIVISTHGRGMFALDARAIRRRIKALAKGDK